MKSKSNSLESSVTLGAWLRQLRKARKLPLRSVAAVAQMDSTLLSKIELGQRLPTTEQAKIFANFFKVPLEEMEAKRLAERFWMDHGDNPAAKKAALLIKEQAAEYKTFGNSGKMDTVETGIKKRYEKDELFPNNLSPSPIQRQEG